MKHARSRLRLALPLGALLAASASAAPTSFGPQLQVNTYTPGPQRGPDVAVNEDGHAFVVWGNGSLSRELRGRVLRAGADGAVGAPDRPLHDPAERSESAPRAASLADGRFVAAWLSDDQPRVRARGFDASGSPLGSAFTVATLSGYPAYPEVDVAPLPDGGFVVAWSGGYDEQSRVDARIVGPDGELGNPIPVGAPAGVIGEADLTALFSVSADSADDGSGFVVAWQDSACIVGVGCGTTLFARGFDETGLARAEPSPLTTRGVAPRIAPAPAARFVVAWAPGYDDPAGARAVSASGEPTSDAGPISPSVVGSRPVAPAVGADGVALVAFPSEPARGVTDLDIGAVLIEPDGGGAADDFIVSAYTTGRQQGPVAAVTPSGAFLVVWQSEGSSGDDDSEESIQARYLGAPGTIPIFVDGFESGAPDGWDAISPAR